MANSGTAQNELEVAVTGILEFDIQDLIRIRAYELYEERGRIDGFTQEDWLRAESEILALHDAIPKGVACVLPCAEADK